MTIRRSLVPEAAASALDPRGAGVPTGFGTIEPADAPGDPGARAAREPRADAALGGASDRSVFDVCHAGVVLRALLFVHGVLAIGASFAARSLAGWALAFATASAAALPAVLAWLLVACTGRRVFGRWPVPAQWLLVVALGAACGAAGALLAGLAVFETDLAESPHWIAALLAGAAFAAALFLWLRMRNQALLPAATSARLAELQSRIRPHFLFNTLNTALALVRSDPRRAETVLEDLAELFRVAIADNAASTSLADELQLAERYLAIEQVRFGTRLRLIWEIDPAAGGARVPPLLLQPLVENAVRHGVEPNRDGGTIRVRTEASAGRALVSVSNSLPSVASAPGHGIALRNVRERLRLLHDVAAAFDVRRDAEVYEVRIAVPL